MTLEHFRPLGGGASSAPAARRGRVRTVGRAFVDDGGVWNPLGASLFWALWAEKHDPEKLERDLAYVAARGFDFVRIFAMVGSSSWSDRVINPRDADYKAVREALFARLKRHALRAALTVFADAQAMMPEGLDRRNFAAENADFAEAHAEQFVWVEVANEHAGNGIESIAEVRALGNLMRGRTGVSVALSAPNEPHVTELYGGWQGIATMHYDRTFAERGWRTYRQPYGAWGEYREKEHYDGPLPGTVVNNEPIGPDSSVASDSDPLRLAMGFATTFIVGNGAYVYHCGGGIRGGGQADLDKGRKANVSDYDACVGGIVALRELLPPGLATWQRSASHHATFPFDFDFDGAYKRGDLSKFYLATNGARQIGALLGIYANVPAKARVSGTWAFHDPHDGSVAKTFTLAAGQSFTFPADRPGYLVIGASQ